MTGNGADQLFAYLESNDISRRRGCVCGAHCSTLFDIVTAIQSIFKFKIGRDVKPMTASLVANGRQ